MLQRIAQDWTELRSQAAFRRSPVRVLWRAAAWSMLCLLRIPPKARFSEFGFTLFLPPQWRHGGGTAAFLLREDYSPDLKVVVRHLQPGMVFVDGGANTRVYTFTAATLVGTSGCVLAFEPGLACYQGLLRSVEINRLENVRVRRLALSDRCSSARLYHHAGKANSFSLAAENSESYDEIQTVTLEQALANEGIERLDFLKLDVQGAQELVLRGGQDLIRRCRPTVLVEIDPGSTRRMNLDPDGCLELLRTWGYSLFSIDGEGSTTPLQADRKDRTVLALPNERPVIA